MKSKPATRIVELVLHRSMKHPKWAHVIATLMPCGHKKKIGACLMDGTDSIRRVDTVRLIKYDDYAVLDKEYCLERRCYESILGDVPLLEELETLEIDE